jgi:peptide/nickel transport system substrate-binding protein
MRSKLFVIVSLLIAATMLLTACQPAAPETIIQTVVVEGKVVEVVVTATPEAPAKETIKAVTPPFKNPDTLMVITGAGEPETLDPAWTYETAGSTTELNIYEGLVFFKRESTTEYVPSLATDWTTSEDGKQWVFNIRKGVKFHKGGTLEPHDIAYTVARANLQGRIDGWQWITYEAFFGTDFSLGSSKDFAAAYAKKATFEELSPADLVTVKP